MLATNRPRLLLAATAMLALISGCNQPPGPTPQVCLSEERALPSLAPKLANGKTDPEGLFDAVACVGGVELGEGKTSPCGSATLITPKMLLTARHLGTPGNGAMVLIKFGAEARNNPKFTAKAIRCWEFRNTGPALCCNHVYRGDEGVTPAAYEAYRSSCPRPLADNEFVLSDVAVWELDQRITKVKPIPVALTTPEGNHDLLSMSGTIGIAVGMGSYDSCTYVQTNSGTRRFGPVRLDETQVGEISRSGDGSPAPYLMTAINADYWKDWAFLAPGDSGGPLLVNYGELDESGCASIANLRVIGEASRGCNYSWGSTIYKDVSDGLRTVLDPDGDGIQRGELDGAGTAYIDADLDGLAELNAEAKATNNDNCPFMHNPDQKDSDGDGLGDACEPVAAGSEAH